MPKHGLLIATTCLLLVTAVIAGIPPAAASAPVTIHFLTWKPNQPRPWQVLIRRFEKQHPDIRVDLQLGPHSATDYHAVVSQRLKNADTSVDVFFMDVTWPAEFAGAGWLLPLDDRFPAAERKEFLPAPLAANRIGGKTWGVPCYLGAGLLYYRADLLQRHGFTPPKTWEELLLQGKAIRQAAREAGDQVPWIYSGQFKQYEGLVCNLLEFIWSHGGTVANLDAGTLHLDTPAVRTALALVRDRFIGTAAPEGVLSYEEPESLALFTAGRAIFHRNWPYAYAVANDPQRAKIAGNVGVTMLPAAQGHEPAAALGGWQFGISRFSRQPDAAWRFIAFMTSPESQKLLALEAGLAPTRRAVYDDDEIKQKLPHLRDFLPAFEHARPRPQTPVYPMLSQELQRFFSAAISRPDSDLKELAAAAERRLAPIIALHRQLAP
jgi:multiple sugar transport system substrate-binding protein